MGEFEHFSETFFIDKSGKTIRGLAIRRPKGIMRWYISPADWPAQSRITVDVQIPDFATQRGDHVVVLNCFYKNRYWDEDEMWDVYPNIGIPDSFSEFRGLEANPPLGYQEGLVYVRRLAQAFRRHTS